MRVFRRSDPIRHPPVLQQFAFKYWGSYGGWRAGVEFAKRGSGKLDVSAGWPRFPRASAGWSRFSYRAEVSPTEEQWRDFRNAVDALDVWQWESERFSMIDAGYFELILADEARTLRWQAHSHGGVMMLVSAIETLVGLPLTHPFTRTPGDLDEYYYGARRPPREDQHPRA